MVVNSRSAHSKGVVLIRKRKKGFALYVCIRDAYTVEQRRIIIEDSEKIIVVTEEIGIGLGERRAVVRYRMIRRVMAVR
jgi:hypothetical protein